MSPSSLGGGKQTTTAGEHISQLVETLIGNLNNGVIITLNWGENNGEEIRPE